MKILFSTGSLFFLPAKNVFQLCRDAGFDGCDLVIDGRFGNEGYMDEILECCEILPVYSIHAPYMKIPAWGDTASALQKTIEVAKTLKAHVVNFHPPSWVSMEIAFYRWFSRIENFQQELDCGDVFLTIENMPRIGKRLMLAPYIMNDYRELIEYGIEKNLFFTFDTTHLATFDEDVIGAFLKYFRTGRLKNIHLSDYVDTQSHLFLGRGELPVAKLLNAMRRLGYDGMITLELSPFEWPKAEEWLMKMLRYSADYLRLHLGM